jgi:hypothetical protein
MTMTDDKVLLSLGPCDGERVPRPQGRNIIVELSWTEMVARYRQTRDRDVFRFDGYDRVVMRISPASDEERRG